MDTSSSPRVNACIIDIENYIINQFAKDQRPYKYEELQLAVEKPVDFESLRVNGFPSLREAFKKQDLLYYFDVLNGPIYTELVKEFWMKAKIITRGSYNEAIAMLVKEKPELQGKNHKEMGVRPFLGVKIESYVAGLRVSIKMEHILEALKLSSNGLVLKTADSVEPEVQLALYGKETKSKSNVDLTRFHKVIYKIFIESIVPKLGGTDQISVVQKLFMYNVARGNLVNVGRLIFLHLLEAINSGKATIHHGRLLSHMFVQVGLLDAVKPFFPGFGTFMNCTQVVNNTTLRYIKLVKNDEIIHPQNPLLCRETEDGI
jgi:hypothetical protein